MHLTLATHRKKFLSAREQFVFVFVLGAVEEA
jgi:hypothetical protein